MSDTKHCKRCDRTLAVAEFHSTPSKGGRGLFWCCKRCGSERSKEAWRKLSAEEKKRRMARSSAWHKDPRFQAWLTPYLRRPDVKARAKERLKIALRDPVFREKYRARIRRWRRKNAKYRVAHSIRERLRECVLKKKEQATENLVGCSWAALMVHLEDLFKPGMSWENYGGNRSREKRWEIDHIKPLAAFNLTVDAEVKAAFHYTNLQPLWGNENALKSDSWTQ